MLDELLKRSPQPKSINLTSGVSVLDGASSLTCSTWALVDSGREKHVNKEENHLRNLLFFCLFFCFLCPSLSLTHRRLVRTPFTHSPPLSEVHFDHRLWIICLVFWKMSRRFLYQCKNDCKRNRKSWFDDHLSNAVTYIFREAERSIYFLRHVKYTKDSSRLNVFQYVQNSLKCYCKT